MISVKDLSFSYGSHEVLKGITFDAVPGELLCVLGHNGAGKSTLFKCMLGILKGYSGSVTIDGSDILTMKASEKASKVAYIPQAANPAFTYSVLDMVLMGTTPQLKGRFTPGSEEKDIAIQAIRKLGIEDLAARSYTKISGGEQQLVLIARALAQGAKILIMDEPTSSLDYGNQMRVQKQLAAVCDYLGYNGIGTHSFRKWYATEIYKNNDYDIALVQRLLQHSSSAITQRYIGIEPQRIEKAIEGHIKLI